MHFDDTFLARWLAGTLTEAELEAFRQSPDYADYVRLREGLARLSPPVFSTEKSWPLLRAKLPAKAPAPAIPAFRIWRRALLAAASVIVVLLAVWDLVDDRVVTIQTVTAEKRELSLPDGSRVILNAGSKITYRPGRWDDKRSLNLDGEAYFDVRPGHTFAVSTNGGDVTVLGTKFNVYARGGRAMDVACYEGSVYITSFETAEEVTITAGQFVRVTQIEVEPIQAVADTTAPWLRGESSFQSETLRVVFDEMERQYDVQVQLVGVDGARTFSGEFLHGNLPDALQMVCTPMGLQYRIEGKTVKISPD